MNDILKEIKFLKGKTMTKTFISISVVCLLICFYNLYGESRPVKMKIGEDFDRQKLFIVRVAADLPSKASIEVVHGDYRYKRNSTLNKLLKNIDTQGLVELDGFLDQGWRVVSITPLNTQPKNNVLVLSVLLEKKSEVFKN